MRRRYAKIIVDQNGYTRVYMKYHRPTRWMNTSTILSTDIMAAYQWIKECDKGDKRKTTVVLVHTGYMSSIRYRTTIHDYCE